MPRFKLVNGVQVQFTAEEEAARDAEEATWAAGAFDRAIADVRRKCRCLLIVSQIQNISGLHFH